MPSHRIYRIHRLAAKAFAEATTLIADNCPPKAGWPIGPNLQFGRAAQFAATTTEPWLWLEPDCYPLQAGWFQAIAKEYAGCGERYLGNVYGAGTNAYLNGVAVYPADALKDYAAAVEQRIGPFDAYAKTAHLAAKSTTIFNDYRGNIARSSKSAALFHRVKDHADLPPPMKLIPPVPTRAEFEELWKL
jgi:hypothetical protein